ncbi:MAG: LacI family DNA-binding transcriptional regulator [Bacteroidales bacterium]|jgi:LacI family transcriptional regulator
MGKKFKNKDLAAKLGVSGTLVSLVLNNKADQHGIRKDTQEKVLALAKQMGFFSLSREKEEMAPVELTPGIIGMIVPSLNDPFVTGITPYLQKAFSSIGMGFSIITKDPDDLRFERMTSAFKKFFSGLILVGEAADDSTIRALRSTEYPFVLLEKNQKTGPINNISTDNTAGAQLLANHIKKLGYRNIIIADEHKSFKYDQPVIDELEDALSLIPEINKPAIVELERTATDGEIDFEKIETFMRPPFRAEIVIAIHSNLVYALMGMLKKRKLRVPQDIAVISMEDGPGFDLMISPVTCLKKPLPGIAIKAANMIWTEIKNSGNNKFKRQINVTPELVVRNSCGSV